MLAESEATSKLRSLRTGGEGSEHLGEVMAGFQGVSERLVEADFVDVVAAATGPQHVAGVNEILDDAVHRPFADTDQPGDLGQPNLRVLRDAHQHVGMVGQERP